MRDRFTRGFVAGVIAAVPALLWNIISVYLLKISNLRWADFAALFILGKLQTTISEEIFCDLAALFFAGLMGVLFAYILITISSRNILLKGWIFGVSIWFFVFALTHLFRTPELALIGLGTVFSNLFGATIWGLVVGYSFGWLDGRVASLGKGR